MPTFRSPTHAAPTVLGRYQNGIGGLSFYPGARSPVAQQFTEHEGQKTATLEKGQQLARMGEKC